MVNTISKLSNASNSKLKGIGGWLHFFIFSFSVGLIVSLIKTLEDLKFITRSTEFDILWKIGLALYDSLLLILAVVITIYAFYLLYKIKNNAIPLIKWLIILHIAFGVYYLFTFDYNNPAYSSIFDKTSLGGLFGEIRNLVVNSIWLLYFIKSKRVKNTFPMSKRRLKTIDKIMITSLFGIHIIFILFIEIIKFLSGFKA